MVKAEVNGRLLAMLAAIPYVWCHRCNKLMVLDVLYEQGPDILMAFVIWEWPRLHCQVIDGQGGANGQSD